MTPTSGGDPGGAGAGRLPLFQRLLFALLPTVVLLGALEVGLRLQGFEFHDVPVHVRFGPNLAADMERNLFVPDPVLFWRLRVDPGNAAALGDRGVFNLPFVTPAVAGPARPAVPEIVALGDSCSFFGQPSWPERLGSLLAGRGRAARVWNAAVPGYTSYQGLRRYETEIAARRPAWILVYFGWNDHWLAAREPDHLIPARAGRPVGSELAGLLEGWRTLQAGRALWFKLSTPPPGERPARVPPEQYRGNLAALCGAATAQGTGVVMVTAPGRLGAAETARLGEGGYAAPGADLAALHERYNGVAREVAAACGAQLVDFAAAAEPGFIRPDGIHLTPPGIERLAALVAERIVEQEALRTAANDNHQTGGTP
jgi:lysophospholipase L1-like esterase